jgi:hypothetical protein
MHDAITEQVLAQRVADTTKLDALMAGKSKPVDATRPKSATSILDSSIILIDAEKFTLIPLGAILHLPAEHRAHIKTKPEGDFLTWPHFLERNASWLGSKEVPRDMVKGSAKAAKPVLREVASDPRVLVSVFKGCPIMILEPEPEAANLKTSNQR